MIGPLRRLAIDWQPRPGVHGRGGRPTGVAVGSGCRPVRRPCRFAVAGRRPSGHRQRLDEGPVDAETVFDLPVCDRREPVCNVVFTDAGWSSSVARWAHNPEVAGSNPVPATTVARNPGSGPHPYSPPAGRVLRATAWPRAEGCSIPGAKRFPRFGKDASATQEFDAGSKAPISAGARSQYLSQSAEDLCPKRIRRFEFASFGKTKSVAWTSRTSPAVNHHPGEWDTG